MSPSNETRKPAGRPSLLSAEQQNSLGNQPVLATALTPAEEAPRRKHLWLVGGLSVLAIAAAIAVVQFGDGQAEPPAAIAAAAQTPPPAPSPAPPVAPVQAPVDAQVADAAPAVAAIIDEAPPAPEVKPKESLAQMLESGVPPASKPAPAKPVHKPVKEKAARTSDRAIAAAAPEQDTDVELLAALVAHAKFDTSANARLSLPKALEQCKKQEKQDAALCRIRVCEGRWKKDECRAYNRSKLEKVASGA
ncbi:hypothetical protein GM658_07960 [Pseudoduganella eburnea]|uniref:Uncharacterized protein n=1 Tax=Massilia eburnea TaxID=1776165 RepID=A0A6L6QF83_9BURK|nr:hypothetical protein [Massilia eburnea]MTW10537.1 hypothetical protein [Massilia eburnea]